MNQDDPYKSPGEADTQSIDPKLMHAVATRLADARTHPPTLVRTLTKWPGTPLLVLVGVVGTVVVAVLSTSSNSALTSHWTLGFAAMSFGAFLRDLGLARRVKRMWPPQSYFIDWEKVDEEDIDEPENDVKFEHDKNFNFAPGLGGHGFDDGLSMASHLEVHLRLPY